MTINSLSNLVAAHKKNFKAAEAVDDHDDDKRDRFVEIADKTLAELLDELRKTLPASLEAVLWVIEYTKDHDQWEYVCEKLFED